MFLKSENGASWNWLCLLLSGRQVYNFTSQMYAQENSFPSLFPFFLLPAYLTPQGNLTSLLSIGGSPARHGALLLPNLQLNINHIPVDSTFTVHSI